jgi:hypothetical protein
MKTEGEPSFELLGQVALAKFSEAKFAEVYLHEFWSDSGFF